MNKFNKYIKNLFTYKPSESYNFTLDNESRACSK